jgi:PBSX family phage terminase large subunit
MDKPFSDKQLEFILKAFSPWNFAHGSVSTGKTVCTLFRFLQAVNDCPDSEIAMIGKTSTTLYNNVINLIFECPQLALFRPFCNWMPSKRALTYKNKTVTTYGAKDEGAVQLIQGRSLSLAYCDEMTLYPDSFIHMLDSRLRKAHSMGFGAMNPAHPEHIVKQWIDKGVAGDPNYYSLHFTLEADAPFLSEIYKKRVVDASSGLFYKRNVLGLWCLAEGAIFDFFDRAIHVCRKAPAAAEYFIAGVDFGLNNPCACVIVGVNTGIRTQSSKKVWAEAEYFWDHKKRGRMKSVSELAKDIAEFIEPYGVRSVYIDPSGLPLKVDLSRLGVHTVDADNEVLDGIALLTSEMSKGTLYISENCKNLIREVETYVWDAKESAKGYDEPIKKDDHALDAFRYAMATHKVASYNPRGTGDSHDPDKYRQARFDPGGRRF